MLSFPSELVVREYEEENGLSPFAQWFDTLDSSASLKITTALERMALGHRSSMKSVGHGVSEYKIDFGPGYCIYFGMEGNTLVILLGGGTKKRQQQDIATAQARWNEYKRRKKTTERS